MAATHQFTQTVNIGPQRYDAGRQINATEIPKGNFDSLTRLGVLVPVIATVAPLRTPTPEPEPEPTPADDSTTGDDPEAAAEKEAAKAKAAAEAATEAEAAKAKATTKKK